MIKLKQYLLASGFTLVVGHAQAAVAVVVSASSPTPTLSIEQVSDIFLGKASKLPDGNSVVPIDQKPNLKDAEEFNSKVTKKNASQLKSYWSKLVFSGKAQAPKQLDNAEEVKKLISANSNMIGYIDASLVDASVKVVLPL
jgi:ABC-type phosphate transport system substrate-binding protein